MHHTLEGHVAEIRVVREKRGGMGWLWVVLLLLVLAGVAYWLWSTGRLGGNGTGATTRPDTTSEAPMRTPSSAALLDQLTRAA
jgi:hypothetical protein